MKQKLIQMAKGVARRSVIGIPFMWLFLFFLLPFIIVLKVSFAEPDYFPPYHSLLSWAEDQLSIVLYYGNYLFIFKDDDWSYLTPYLHLLELALFSTLIALCIGYLITARLVKLKNRTLQYGLLWLIAVPTVITLLLHGYAVFTDANQASIGIVNHFLLNTGVISTPIKLLSEPLFVYFSIILTHLSLIVFPLFWELNNEQYHLYPQQLHHKIPYYFPKKSLLLGAFLMLICVLGKYIIPNPLGLGNFIGSLYLTPYLNSLELAFFSTLLCLLIGYPMAYAIAKAPKSTQTILILLVVMPTWTALLIRVYAWTTILGNGENGLLNQFLLKLGIISSPIEVLNTYIAVYIGVVYAYLPFMILPLYANLVKHDTSLLEAASDLGCKGIKAFWAITFPLSKAGITAGCMLVFIPVIGEFVIPELLGGSETQLIGQAIYREYFNNNNWSSAAALAIIMLILLIIPIILFNRHQSKSLEAKS